MIEKREVFKHRIDKLETKVHNMTTGLITEYFAPGRPDCLKGILHFCFYMYVSDLFSCIYQTYSGYTPCILQVSVFKSWLPYRQSRKWSSNHGANSLRTQTYFRSSLFSTWKVPFREEGRPNYICVCGLLHQPERIHFKGVRFIQVYKGFY